MHMTHHPKHSRECSEISAVNSCFACTTVTTRKLTFVYIMYLCAGGAQRSYTFVLWQEKRPDWAPNVGPTRPRTGHKGCQETHQSPAEYTNTENEHYLNISTNNRSPYISCPYTHILIQPSSWIGERYATVKRFLKLALLWFTLSTKEILSWEQIGQSAVQVKRC